jgi:hypothetical protein
MALNKLCKGLRAVEQAKSPLVRAQKDIGTSVDIE